MYTTCKYVVMKTVDGENMFLFPARVVHRTVANKMKGTPVSAGFVGYMGDTFRCRGRSESLGLRYRGEQDNILLMELLNL